VAIETVSSVPLVHDCARQFEESQEKTFGDLYMMNANSTQLQVKIIAVFPIPQLSEQID
jgi:hypothetical protein